MSAAAQVTPLSGTAWVGEMDDRIYHADPCDRPSLSSSVAKIVCNQSLAHVRLRHPRLDGVPMSATAALDDGDMLHALLLTGRDSERVALIDELNPKTGEPYTDFKTKRAQELRDQARAEGRTPVLPKHMRRVRSAYARIHEAMCAKDVGLAGRGIAEQVVIWEVDGVQCRAKIDHWDADNLLITDLKSCETAKPSILERVITNLGYDIQCAAYLEAVETALGIEPGRVQYSWVFVEKEPPWCVTVMHPPEAMLDIGRCKWQYAKRRWSEALESGMWPDYTGNEPVWAWPSSFAMQECEERFRDEEAA